MNFGSDSEILSLQRIDALVDFLRTKPSTLNAYLDHLLVDTFFGRSAFAHILHVVRNDGSLAMPAKSGFKLWPTEKFPDRFITADTPLNRALRSGDVVECGSYDSFSFAGPDYLDDLFPNGFGASIAWPIPGIGSVLTFFEKDVQLTTESSLFLHVVGNIISLGLQDSLVSAQIERGSYPKHVVSSFTLTSRQWTILKSVRKGMTNPQIAEDLGFSESLVRHETMKIYSKLRISGRKELIDLPEEFFPIHND